VSASSLALDEAAWDSPWRHRSVLEKGFLSIGLVLAALLLPTWPGAPAVGAVATVILLGPARLAPGLLARIIRWPLAFLISGVLSVSISLSWHGHPVIGLSRSGIAAGAALLAHGLAGALAVFVLAATTPMVDLLESLRRVRLPAACVDIAALTYRLLFTLVSTTRQVRESQAARLGYSSWRHSVESAAYLTAAVLVRSLANAQRLEEGLAGRGYVDELSTVTDSPRVSGRVLMAGAIGLALLAVVSLWSAS